MRSMLLWLCAVESVLGQPWDRWYGYEYSERVFELLGLIVLVCVCVWCMLPTEPLKPQCPRQYEGIRIEPRDVVKRDDRDFDVLPLDSEGEGHRS